MNSETKPIVWTLEEGIAFARQIEEHLRGRGFHAAISGGVLWRGSSTKDLDIIIYPHQSDECDFEHILKPLMLPLLDAPWKQCDHEEYEDSKIVMKSTVKGKTVDFFLLQ